jgi:hypothetical protein
MEGSCLDSSGLMGLLQLSHAKGNKVWCKLTHQELQEHDQSCLPWQTCCPCFLELHLVLCVLLAGCALVLLDWLAMLRFLELRTDAVLCVLLAVLALVLLD